MEPTKVMTNRGHYFRLEEPAEQPKGSPDYPRYETHRNGHRVLLNNAAEHQAFYDDHEAAGQLTFTHNDVEHEVSKPVEEVA